MLAVAAPIAARGAATPVEPKYPASMASGTLPIMYINVYSDDGFDNEIIDYNLNHKEYFKGYYYIDSNGCDLNGLHNIASAENPLPLEIKARGNFTRKAYSKKPFKIKLGNKQSILGLPRNKHFVLLPHADDMYSYLRNFTAFNLGKRIDLPWTPSQQPIEVVINNDYRGLYFLTESIRVGAERIDIEPLDGKVQDPELISGGYIVEIDNYITDNQIVLKEKSSIEDEEPGLICITFDTPEICSDIQQQFLSHQFNAINNAVGECSDSLWNYIDLDIAARYYLIMEIVGHTEAYSGSTYLYRNRGADCKWIFSPLWDCGHAFDADPGKRLFEDGRFNNHWIKSICTNRTFQSKVEETWMWFMSNRFNGVLDDIDNYISSISAAAIADANRWRGAPSPLGYEAFKIIDNSNIVYGKESATSRLKLRIEYLKEIFGDFAALTGPAPEPKRDTSPAAPLPDFTPEEVPETAADWPLYDLTGRRVVGKARRGIYVMPGFRHPIYRTNP